MSEPIELNELIQALRQELVEAKKKADQENPDLVFKVESVDVELQTAVTKVADGKGGFKFKFWTVNADLMASGKFQKSDIQKIALKLSVEDHAGQSPYINSSSQEKE